MQASNVRSPDIRTSVVGTLFLIPKLCSTQFLFYIMLIDIYTHTLTPSSIKWVWESDILTQRFTIDIKIKAFKQSSDALYNPMFPHRFNYGILFFTKPWILKDLCSIECNLRKLNHKSHALEVMVNITTSPYSTALFCWCQYRALEWVMNFPWSSL